MKLSQRLGIVLGGLFVSWIGLATNSTLLVYSGFVLGSLAFIPIRNPRGAQSHDLALPTDPPSADQPPAVTASMPLPPGDDEITVSSGTGEQHHRIA